MRAGCHSFESGKLHAIFDAYTDSGVDTRFEIIWQALTKRGIVGYVYYRGAHKSDSIERDINKMGDYGKIY